MAISVQTLVNRVQETLLDPDEQYWTVPEIIDYIDAAVRAVSIVKPDSYTVTESFTPTPMTTTQHLPVEGYAFLDITKQLTPTVRSLTQVSRNHMDHADPEWHNTTGSVIRHYIFDERNPQVFYLYPAPTSGVTLELIHSSEPMRIGSISDTIPVMSVYENPIYHYTLSLCWAKNTKRGDLTKSQIEYQMFAGLLGLKTQIQYPFSPQVPRDNR